MQNKIWAENTNTIIRYSSWRCSSNRYLNFVSILVYLWWLLTYLRCTLFGRTGQQPLLLIYYRPQTKLAKVMFLYVSVHGGRGSTWAGTPRTRYIPRTRYTLQTRYTPQNRYTSHTRYTPHPGPGTSPLGPGVPPQTRYTPEQCMLGDTGNKRAVHILLECILVW